MKSFYEKTEYTIRDLQMLIDTQAEENVYLEFKEAGALDKDQRKKFDVSKDVAAFANSDGGVIIYGMREKDHKAHSITYIDGRTFSKEWLEQVINSGIQRHIQGVEIIPVRVDDDLAQSVYIVKIPRSTHAPHMSDDQKFYKRNNFQAVAMQEYEVRDLYDRQTSSTLTIDDVYIESMNLSFHTPELKIAVVVGNDGDVFEQYYKVAMYLEKTPTTIDYDFDRSKISITYLNGPAVKFSTTSSVPIFPGEGLAVMHIQLNINSLKPYEELAKVQCYLNLFYGKHNKRFDFNLLELAVAYSNSN